MKNYIKRRIERMMLENAELKIKATKARLECMKQIVDCEKKLAKQLDIETAIKEAKDGTDNS